MSKVNIIKKIYRDLPQPIKVLAQPIRFVYGIPSAIKKEVLLEVKLISGKLKDTDLDLDILVIGKSAVLSYIIDRFLEKDYKITYLGKTLIWNLPKKIKVFENKIDITLSRLHKLFSFFYSNNGYYVLPARIRQRLDLDLPLERITEKFRMNVTSKVFGKLRKYKYTYTVSHDEKQLQDFYENMYVPYANFRFGKLMNISSYEDTREFFKEGGLLLINYQDKAVCANVFTKTNGEYGFRRIGVSKDGINLLKNDILSALYYYSIIYAKKMGCDVIDFGNSNPFLNDGVFFHKRKWGCRVCQSSDLRHFCLFKINCHNEVTKRLLMDNPFITIRNNKLIGNVFDFDREVSDESLQKDLKNRYSTPGLELDCITKNQNNHSLLRTRISEKGRVLNQSIINDLCDRQDAKYR